MPILSIVNQARGPLTISGTFKAPTDGPACFVVSGSVWSTSANEMIGFAVELDGVPIGSAQIFSNGPSTHRDVVPGYIPVELTYAQHTVALVPLNPATTSDSNDSFNIMLLY